ncbi:hypothetical protein [Pseudactinotalea terrae]|uniref:hypothetical protein n=1 Tax=Pseudactinotalea terrae TaxID=1743262 RepID=UPI0012E218D3|nr:hypothetical protein [Pseudactinotalea terrae]
MDAIKRLLWTVKHCQDLRALLRHPSVTITTSGPGFEAFTVQMPSAGMSALALTHTGEVLSIASPGQLVQHASTTTALLVADLMAEGSADIREAI